MAKKRNPVKKIKFGGGNLQLGGGTINHFRGWTSTGDAFSLRDFQNSFNRIAKTLSKKFDVPHDFNIDGTIEPPENISEFEADVNLNIVDHPYTGYYKLSYNGSETRKIPYYLNSTDLNQIFREDLGSDFYVTNVGSLSEKSFGPYNFIAKTNGAKNQIQVSENFDENEINATLQVDNPGGVGFPSLQSLKFETPSKTSFNYDINFFELDHTFSQKWQYKGVYRIYDLTIGAYSLSGTTEWKDLNPTSKNYSAVIDYPVTPEDTIIQPFSIDIGNVYSGLLPLVQGDILGGKNEEIYITGIVPTNNVSVHTSIGFGNLDINIDLQGNNSFNVDYFYLGGGSDMFTGSNYLNLSSIKINNELNLKSFNIKQDDFPTTEYVKSIDLSGCSNLTHFNIESFTKNLTGLFLQDCSITGLNTLGYAMWVENPSSVTYYYAPGLDEDNKIQNLNISNNKLDATGVLNILTSIDNGYTGHLDLRNQTPPIIYDQNLIELIDVFVDMGWEIKY